MINVRYVLKKKLLFCTVVCRAQHSEQNVYFKLTIWNANYFETILLLKHVINK